MSESKKSENEQILTPDDIANALTITAYHYPKEMKNIKTLAKTYQAPETLEAFPPKTHITANKEIFRAFVFSLKKGEKAFYDFDMDFRGAHKVIVKHPKFYIPADYSMTENEFETLMFQAGDITKFNYKNFYLYLSDLLSNMLENKFSVRIFEKLIQHKFLYVHHFLEKLKFKLDFDDYEEVQPYLFFLLNYVTNHEIETYEYYDSNEKKVETVNLKEEFLKLVDLILKKISKFYSNLREFQFFKYRRNQNYDIRLTTFHRIQDASKTLSVKNFSSFLHNFIISPLMDYNNFRLINHLVFTLVQPLRYNMYFKFYNYNLETWKYKMNFEAYKIDSNVTDFSMNDEIFVELFYLILRSPQFNFTKSIKEVHNEDSIGKSLITYLYEQKKNIYLIREVNYKLQNSQDSSSACLIQ